MANSKPCPTCKGKITTDGLQQKHDKPCDMCKGLGKVFPDFVCICGRPAMVQTGATLTCGRQTCVDKTLGLQGHQKVQEPLSDEEVNYWDYMRGQGF